MSSVAGAGVKFAVSGHRTAIARESERMASTTLTNTKLRLEYRNQSLTIPTSSRSVPSQHHRSTIIVAAPEIRE